MPQSRGDQPDQPGKILDVGFRGDISPIETASSRTRIISLCTSVMGPASAYPWIAQYTARSKNWLSSWCNSSSPLQFHNIVGKSLLPEEMPQMIPCQHQCPHKLMQADSLRCPSCGNGPKTTRDTALCLLQ
jgi:hypothetical protein